MFNRPLALALVAMLSAVAAARAQDFPTKPVTLVSPITPGASSDASARLFAQYVSESLGQRMVVENRPGGGGVVASLLVKEAKPDGYTLLLANVGSHAILQATQTLTYDPVKDFAPVALLFAGPNVLAVPTALNVNTVAELKALATSKPGGLSYGTQGVGSGGHLLGAMLQEKFGVPMTAVHYKGGAPLTVDLVAGRVDLSFGGLSSVKQYVADGKLKILAVLLPKRWNRVPEIPTMTEAGFPGIDLETWYGAVAPLGTPKAVIDKLNGEFAKAGRNPDLVKRLDDIDILSTVNTPQEFGDFLASEADRLGKIAKANNVRAE